MFHIKILFIHAFIYTVEHNPSILWSFTLEIVQVEIGLHVSYRKKNESEVRGRQHECCQNTDQNTNICHL